MRHLCTWLALLVGLGFVLAVPSNAAEKADPETINKLIEKLSSNRFAEREKAQKALEEIGLPALDALKKAVEESKDMEGKRRAKELLTKLEKQVQAAKILAPKRLRLNYKDTPLSEAIADLKKKSGYEITLHDPEGKLKDRKITLDTGETTFWEAFDRFCAKAGLVEGSAQDLQQIGPGGGPGGVLPGNGGGIQPLPPIQIQPVKPIRKLPPQKAPVEKDVRGPELKQGFAVAVAEDAPAQAAEKKEAEAKEKAAAEEAARAKAVAQAKAAEEAAVRAKVAAQQAAQAAQAPAVQPVQGRVRIRPGRPFPIQPNGQPGQLILKDGKAKDVPTSYSGAVRVQAMDDVAQMFGGAQNGEFLTGLKVSPEPKIRWQSLVALRIDKAIDDQDQKLTQAMDAPAGPGGGPAPPFGGIGGGGIGFARPAVAFPNFGGLHQYLPVRLKKGEKASKSLKEFAGSITAQVLAEPEIHITADNILKASGKTFKGKEGGSIKVNSVTEKEQQLTLGLEIEQPANVVPAGQGFGGGGWGGGFNGGGPIQILPAVPPQAQPPALPKGAFQVQAQAQPAIQVAPVQIQVQQIQIGGGGGIVIGGGGPGFFGNTNGLELLDEKGNVIPCVGAGMVGRGAPGGGAVTFEHQMTFQLQKDQKPAKLVFKGSKSVNVEIPFMLKNVPLK